jgi:hypothetical protein
LRARAQLGRDVLYRRNPHDQHRQSNGHADAGQQSQERAADQRAVERREPETDAHDRAEERRDEHRPDHHRCRTLEQAKRGDGGREHDQKQELPVEAGIARHRGQHDGAILGIVDMPCARRRGTAAGIKVGAVRRGLTRMARHVVLLSISFRAWR